MFIDTDDAFHPTFLKNRCFLPCNRQSDETMPPHQALGILPHLIVDWMARFQIHLLQRISGSVIWQSDFLKWELTLILLPRKTLSSNDSRNNNTQSLCVRHKNPGFQLMSEAYEADVTWKSTRHLRCLLWWKWLKCRHIFVSNGSANVFQRLLYVFCI